jgi:Electron transfer flavoprotein, alpha subunit
MDKVQKRDSVPVTYCLNIYYVSTFVAGNAILTFKSKDPVKVITVRGTNFEPTPLEGGSTATENAPAGEYKTELSQFLSQELSKSDRPELTSAKVVISGGE